MVYKKYNIGVILMISPYSDLELITSIFNYLPSLNNHLDAILERMPTELKIDSIEPMDEISEFREVVFEAGNQKLHLDARNLVLTGQAREREVTESLVQYMERVVDITKKIPRQKYTKSINLYISGINPAPEVQKGLPRLKNTAQSLIEGPVSTTVRYKPEDILPIQISGVYIAYKNRSEF